MAPECITVLTISKRESELQSMAKVIPLANLQNLLDDIYLLQTRNQASFEICLHMTM